MNIEQLVNMIKSTPGAVLDAFGLMADIITRYWWVAAAAFVVGIVWDLIDLPSRRRHDPDCVFCRIIGGTAPATVVRRWRWLGVIAIVPLNPVSPDHVLILPTRHVRDCGESAWITAKVMWCASRVMGEYFAANIITSKGAWATQTIWHAHVHVCDRREGDGLPLLWTGQVIDQDAV